MQDARRERRPLGFSPGNAPSSRQGPSLKLAAAGLLLAEQGTPWEGAGASVMVRQSSEWVVGFVLAAGGQLGWILPPHQPHLVPDESDLP
ncbi:hypothetical protein EYF80_008440 [Liparis tanakae]|uniref:Uncharacterized protein n=1 Tax=Liparis tanakae TaxID=230148 RepID=A0A4Z2IV39_9TELE|nr:hypothetical protein EYF80_008440 [Liparis tanakae]